MKLLAMENFGEAAREKRGSEGIRATAAAIGISPATLSRIENGHLPDLETFRRICEWLGANPADVLGFQSSAAATTPIEVHFRKQPTQQPETMAALGEMIAAAQLALDERLIG
ncbi:helix-turn-helix transcriptional regulator [Agrobacterium cavarae]|uniref:helix-turn-helix domain-containing protein n=1 Tax=Agrobacterium cavarae TaxID=2528239 RepID=UPI002FF625B1